MHSVLVATALVGGLAAGDSGRNGGVDPGRVCVDFGGEWEGVVQQANGDVSVRITLGGGRVMFGQGQATLATPCRIVPDGPGRLRLNVGEQPTDFFGIYKLHGRTLSICFSLRPGKRPTSFAPGPEKKVWFLRRRNSKTN